MELSYLDKNKNRFIIRGNILTYIPVQAPDSSSGSYDGGIKRFINLQADQIEALSEATKSLQDLSEKVILTKGTSELRWSGKRFFLRHNSPEQKLISNHLNAILITKNQQLVHSEYVSKAHTKKISVLLDGISDQENIGMAFRIAEAFGVSELMLCHSMFEEITKKVERISRQTSKRIPFNKSVDALATISKYRNEGYLIIAIELTNQSMSIGQFDFAHYDQILVIMGSEQQGISSSILNEANVTLHIPMYGSNSSMNVIQAMGIALNELVK